MKKLILPITLLILLTPLRLPSPTTFSMKEGIDPHLAQFPPVIGTWKGEEVPLEEQVYKILETTNILSRVYTDEKGERLHLLIVGSSRNRRAIHPPEVCYETSGYEIASKRTLTLEGNPLPQKIPVTELVVARNGSQEKVLYFYQVGSELVPDYLRGEWRFLKTRFLSKKAPIYLIRISNLTDPGSNPSESSSLRSFLSKVLPLLSPPHP